MFRKSYDDVIIAFGIVNSMRDDNASLTYEEASFSLNYNICEPNGFGFIIVRLFAIFWTQKVLIFPSQ